MREIVARARFHIKIIQEFSVLEHFWQIRSGKSITLFHLIIYLVFLHLFIRVSINYIDFIYFIEKKNIIY